MTMHGLRRGICLFGNRRLSQLAIRADGEKWKKNVAGELKATWWLALSILGGSAISSIDEASCDKHLDHGIEYKTHDSVMNWSGTHVCHPKRIYEPKNAQEVLRLLNHLHETNTKARPIGTGLSPNGLGMSEDALISLNHLDYIEVDPKNRLVTVGAGARVSEVLKEVRRHGLTLSNFSSIQEQQIAGWTQVAAHGTGASLPTVEEQIVRMKIATPTEGLLTLGGEGGHHRCAVTRDLFSFAKVGLGALGVVTELTLSLIPQHQLAERTFVTTLPALRRDHYHLLRTYRHVRYMWIPYTSEVVVVCSHPHDPAHPRELFDNSPASQNAETAGPPATEPLVQLLLQCARERHETIDETQVRAWSFAQLRDHLLAYGPLDLAHVKRVNAAELEFWRRSAGSRLADSTEILGFDCGGEQLVFEVAFPIGSLQEESFRDLDFVSKLLDRLAKAGIPAPGPIEQRWTAASSAPMSPAHSASADHVFSWVGIIMYLPPGQTADQRSAIHEAFDQYTQVVLPLVQEYGGKIHWAKIEPPGASPSVAPKKAEEGWWDVLFGCKCKQETNAGELIRGTLERYPLGQFNNYRLALDPREILLNDRLRNLVVDEKTRRRSLD